LVGPSTVTLNVTSAVTSSPAGPPRACPSRKPDREIQEASGRETEVRCSTVAGGLEANAKAVEDGPSQGAAAPDPRLSVAAAAAAQAARRS